MKKMDDDKQVVDWKKYWEKISETGEWRKDALNTKARLSQLEKRLLTEGATSFGSALMLGVMHKRWEKMRGIYKAPPEPPNLQSSFKEWNQRAKQQTSD